MRKRDLVDGNIAPQQGPQEIALYNPTGEPVRMPIEHAAIAIDQGYKIIPPQEVADIRLTESQDNMIGQAKTFLESAAGGATFNLSKLAEAKLGVNPKAMAAREKLFPGTKIAGEVTGILGSLLVGTGEAKVAQMTLGAADVLNPVRAVSKIGAISGEAATAKAADVVAKIANPISSPAVNKIISTAIKVGAGSAVEGAIYGLGQSVDEYALGDPEAMSENLLSNVGWSAALGGAFGAGLGVIGEAGSQALSKFSKSAREKMVPEAVKDAIANQDFGAIANAAGKTEAEQKTIMEGINELKKNSGEIEESGKFFGLDVPQWMKSKNKTVNRLADTLVTGPPTLSSLSVQNYIQSGFKVIGDVYEKILSKGAGTLNETGTKVSKMISDRINSWYQPLEDAYSYLKDVHKEIPISEDFLKRSISQIKSESHELGNALKWKDFDVGKYVDDVISGMESGNIKTIDDLRVFKTQIMADQSDKYALKYIKGVLGEYIDGIEEKAIVRFAENQTKAFPNYDRLVSAIDLHKETKAAYAQFREKINLLGEKLGKGKIYGRQNIVDFLSGEGAKTITPERLVEKLFNTKDANFTRWFAKEFPDEWSAIVDYQKSKIGADVGTKIKSIGSKIDKEISPELKNIMFTAEEQKALRAGHVWMQALPESANPSGTAAKTSLLKYMGDVLTPNPAKMADAVMANIRDAGVKGFIENVGREGANSTFIQKTFGLMSHIEQANIAAEKNMNKGVAALFRDVTPISGALGASLISSINRGQNVNETINQYQDPSDLQSALEKSVGDLHQVAPQTAQNLQIGIGKHVGYLKSKMPIVPEANPANGQMKVSPSEAMKFDKHVKASENPFSVLDDLKSGYVAPETMEALQALYPKTLMAMRSKVLEGFADYSSQKNKPPIPYGRILAISQFLGQDLTYSLGGKALIKNTQANAANARRESEKSMPATSQGLGKLTTGNITMTEMQKISTRRDRV